MKIFTTQTKDNETRYSMVLSQCSFNMAVNWLERECVKAKARIGSVSRLKNGLIKIPTFSGDTPRRNFFYDEDRGYLLGE